MYHMCVCVCVCVCSYVGSVRSSFTNALFIQCIQSTFRNVGDNKLTGSVQAIGKLNKLTQLCVQVRSWLLRMGARTNQTFFVLGSGVSCKLVRCAPAFKNTLAVPCIQFTRRYLHNTRLTGGVEPLGKLTKLTTLCVVK